MIKKKCNKRLSELATKLNKECFGGKTKFTIQWGSRRMTSSFGNAHYKSKLIKISPVIVDLNKISWDSEDLREVIVHELCHLYLYQTTGKCQGHNKLFQAEMDKHCPNATSHTYHSLKTKPKNKSNKTWIHTYECPNCQYQVVYERKTDRRACGKCCKQYNGGKWAADYSFVLVESKQVHKHSVWLYK